MYFTMVLWLIFALFLFIACAILLVLEIFVPSFGLLTVFSLACLAAGIAICFNLGPITGWFGVAAAVFIVPIVWIITYKIFPNTTFGKHVTLGKPDREKGDAIPDTKELEEMLGKQGVVLSPLRPVGICDFNGKRLECVAETGYIEKDERAKSIPIKLLARSIRVEDTLGRAFRTRPIQAWTLLFHMVSLLKELEIGFVPKPIMVRKAVGPGVVQKAECWVK